MFTLRNRADLHVVQWDGLFTLSEAMGSLSGFGIEPERRSKPDRLKPVLLALPADPAIAGVLENDSALGQLVANAVGGRKIAALARGLAFSD